MAPLKFLSLACASALLVAQAHTQGVKGLGASGAGSGGGVTYSIKLDGSAVCLTEINGAREAAGLPKFEAATSQDHKLPETNEHETKPWDKVCKALITEDEASTVPKATRTGEVFKSGTYAFMALTSDQADCTAAVDHWKAAFSNFTSIPPSKTEGEETHYNKQQNISFVALYNPSDGATADCRVVTCSETPSTVERSLRSTPEEKSGYALLCLTTPDAFEEKDTPPFTEDEWSKIKTSLAGSASAVAPSLLALATVAVGLAAL
ncbi:SAG family member [Eimeria brunetti]|uniref:SAG family member n=1 Tax=Eimeria brunetti TaxID=51314 RepID=U6L5I8_9EIME|nr:SAG family member [Eimeria brunetti]